MHARLKIHILSIVVVVCVLGFIFCLPIGSFALAKESVAFSTTPSNTLPPSSNGNSQNNTSSCSFVNDDNAKLFRDASLALCTFALGYYAITFQIAPAMDKHGHKYQQDNHLHILRIKKRVECIEEDTIFSLPIWIFLPIATYVVVFVSSTALYAWFLSSEKNSSSFWALFGLGIASFAISEEYIRHVILMLYGEKWLYRNVIKICKKTKRVISDELKTGRYNHTSRINDVCLRCLTSAFFATENSRSISSEHFYDFFVELIGGNDITRGFFRNAIESVFEEHLYEYEPRLTCLIQLLSSCVMVAKDEKSLTKLIESINNIRNTPEQKESIGMLAICICTLSYAQKKIADPNNSQFNGDLPDFRFAKYLVEKNMGVVYEWMTRNLYTASIVYAVKSRLEDVQKDIIYCDMEIHKKVEILTMKVERFCHLRENDIRVKETL